MYLPINTSLDEIIRNYCAKQCLILIENNYTLRDKTEKVAIIVENIKITEILSDKFVYI